MESGISFQCGNNGSLLFMLYVGYGKKKFCMATIRYDSKSNPAYVGRGSSIRCPMESRCKKIAYGSTFYSRGSSNM